MTLRKAIEIGEDFLNHSGIVFSQSELDSMQLLIEAGKRVEGDRGTSYQPVWYSLPGESAE